jgi:glycosyltransferase involved in cell wall biosynthesis
MKPGNSASHAALRASHAHDQPDPPLRVCYVLAGFHPYASGAERQAQAQGGELVRRGHIVHAVTRHGFDLPRDEVIDGIQVHRWIDTSRVGPLFGVSFVAGVIRALRRLRPEFDLIHTHQGLWEAVATGLGRPWLKGAPTLVQPASSGFYGEAEELVRTRGSQVLRRLILRNTAFAAISADIERQWVDLGVLPSRLVRMASGVDANHFHPGRSFVQSSLPEGPRVVFTGRLHPQKNLDLLFEIWPEVTRRTSARLVLIGDGPDRDRLTRRAAELGITDRVHFTGPVSDPADWLRAADVFALPSVAEGMSNSLLEAMATALPCLASAIGGNTDLLTDGKTGLLIPPGDRKAWTLGLLRVLDDPGLAKRLGAAARERIETEFALTIVVDRYVALYRQLLAGWPG